MCPSQSVLAEVCYILSEECIIEGGQDLAPGCAGEEDEEEDGGNELMSGLSLNSSAGEDDGEEVDQSVGDAGEDIALLNTS